MLGFMMSMLLCGCVFCLSSRSVSARADGLIEREENEVRTEI